MNGDDLKIQLQGEGWAINDYGEKIANTTNDEERRVLTEIRNDEKEHFNKLINLLKCKTKVSEAV